MTGDLIVGAPAPAIALEDQDGVARQLKDWRGKPLVVFFYPRAMTSGCTIEVQEFRDAHAKFQRAGVGVVGISPDTVRAQKKFHIAERLNYPLLADAARSVVIRYGLLKEKNMYGKKVMGVVRTTFLLDGNGVIRHIWEKVKPEGHAAEVLEAARALARSSST